MTEQLGDDDRFLTFKDYAYKEGMDLSPIFIVMSIYLRDIALPLLDFKVKDADKQDD